MAQTNFPKSLYLSAVTPAITVSTVRLPGGGYETALIVDGRITDGVRSAKIADARFAHDSACDFARGAVDTQSTRHAFFAAQVAS